MRSLRCLFIIFITFSLFAYCMADWKDGLTKPGFYAVIDGQAKYLDFKTLSDAETEATEFSLSFFANVHVLGRGDFIALFGNMPESQKTMMTSTDPRGYRYSLNNIGTKYTLKENKDINKFFVIEKAGMHNGLNVFKLTPRAEVVASDIYCIFKYTFKGGIGDYSESILGFKYQFEDLGASLDPNDILSAQNLSFASDKIIAADADAPRWSPNGTKILYMPITTRGPEIWQMNADGSQKEFIVHGTHGCWSPDGTKVAYLVRGRYSYILNIYDLKQKRVLFQDDQSSNIEIKLDSFSTVPTNPHEPALR